MAPFRAAAPKAPKAPTVAAPKATSTKLPAGKTPGAAPISPTDKLANQIATGTFGLNTGAKGAYNPFGTQTQGQVNQQILQQARSQYLPQLQTIQGNLAAENAADPQRVAAITATYKTYGQQAQDAYNQVRNQLSQWLTQNAAGNQAAQQTLGAALNSANVPGQTLDQMLGITAPPGSPAQPYQAAAEAQGQGIQNTLGQLAASDLGPLGEQISNAGLERAQQLDTESLRHRAAVQGLQGQMSALAQQIPSDITTARNAITTQLQNAATTALQNRIAQETLNLNKQNQAFTQGQARQSQAFNESQTRQVNAANIHNQNVTNAQNWARIQQGNTQLDQNAKSIQAGIDSTNAKTIQNEAKLQATAANNVAKTIQAYFSPTKEEIYTTTQKSQPKAGSGQQPVTTRTTHINENQYRQRIQPWALVQQLQDQYGISRIQALQAIQNQPQYYQGNSRLTVGQWAKDMLFYAGVGNEPRDVLQQRQNIIKGIESRVTGQARKTGNQRWARDLAPIPGWGPNQKTYATPQPANWYRNFLPSGYQQAINTALRDIYNRQWRAPNY